MVEQMTLPDDFARCSGVKLSHVDGSWTWRNGCQDCMRRTNPTSNPERVWMVVAPEVDPVHQWCPERIGPGMTFDVGRNG